MTPDELTRQIGPWCEDRGRLEAAPPDRADQSDFVLTTSARPEWPVHIAWATHARRIRLDLRFDMPVGAIEMTASPIEGIEFPSFAEIIESVVNVRPAPLAANVTTDGYRHVITIATHVYLDGLNEHTFCSALDEVLRTRQLIERMRTDIERQREQMAKLEASYAVEDALEATPPIEDPVGPAPQDAPWRPTHAVAAGGLPAWDQPRSTSPPAAHLDARLSVAVIGSEGGWTQVRCSNGWVAWVDGRGLEPITN